MTASSATSNGSLGSIVRVSPAEWKQPVPLDMFEEQLRTRDLALEYRILRWAGLQQRQQMLGTEAITCERGEEGKDRYRYIRGGSSASGIDGGFIAAQAPSQSTALDFWSMILHHGCEVIFVLCQLREGGRSKCAQYWPSPMGASMVVESDGISWRVKLALEESYQHYGGGSTAVAHDEDDHGSEFDLVKRVFEVSVEGDYSIPVKQVVQYQYLSWPDHGTPDVDQFVRVFRVFHTARRRVLRGSGAPSAPILVHCSAGVGRTGCLIALERLVSEAMEQKENEEGTPAVSVLATLEDMRNSRAFMVVLGRDGADLVVVVQPDELRGWRLPPEKHRMALET
ncbi:hypothetical protein FOZ61_007301 [Perkinsus olseni]|uniref:Uncharacterized protein n=1 Tax=Perkinsus olseni TaxID=32597 RepID=A0A7J6M8V2_PEROL|nr:hypothetical protein FOZ61_007301 [Perkinsus olseni]